MNGYKNELGFFITCYDETESIKQAVTSLRLSYPDAPVYVTYESDSDFSFLTTFSNISINKGVDSMGQTLIIPPFVKPSPQQADAIKFASVTLINRITKALGFFDSQYVLLHCPDTFIRGKLTIPSGAGLLGSQVNRYFFPEVNEILVRHGGVPISFFGAVPAIFNVDDFKRGRDLFLGNEPLVNELCSSFYAISSHDILLPILFSLIGKNEEFNPEITECGRNPNWETSGHPLLHQYRFNYPKRASKYKINEAK